MTKISLILVPAFAFCKSRVNRSGGSTSNQVHHDARCLYSSTRKIILSRLISCITIASMNVPWSTHAVRILPARHGRRRRQLFSPQLHTLAPLRRLSHPPSSRPIPRRLRPRFRRKFRREFSAGLRFVHCSVVALWIIERVPRLIPCPPLRYGRR